jgi:hypothetical protein
MMPRGGPSYNWLNTLKERAFSVVQGAGKGCTTIGQDRLVGFKGHGFNQKCVIVEAMENSPNGRHQVAIAAIQDHCFQCFITV